MRAAATMGVLCRRLTVLACAGALAATVCAATDSNDRVRVERTPVRGGGELLTLICEVPEKAPPEVAGHDFPILSVLRDTMGDADQSNDALRNVWVLTYARPSILQRIAASLPFFYMRVGSPRIKEGAIPSAILDMGAAGRRTWPKLIRAVLQTELLDSAGIPVRASTRAYAGNASDFRNEHVWEATNFLAAAKQQSGLPASEEERIEARLLLSTRFFGDLVSEAYLPAAFHKENELRLETRGHNWELLRQKAEENGLYFQPLSLGVGPSAQALLWAERRHYSSSEVSAFNGQFLSISNPFEGSWLEKWSGYTETWYLDATGARVDERTPGARAARMVPVGLYSLDHPRTPLLLVDFRRPTLPKRREMMHRATDQVTAGVLGLATFGNWTYLVANTTWRFVRSRHGAALDPASRLRAYAQLRHALFLDQSLNPELRRDLLRRLQGLSLNPFEDGPDNEARIAREQYAALRRAAAEPGGLERVLARGRSGEIAGRVHSRGALAMLRLASIGTLGLYRHSERITPEMMVRVDQQRRFAWHKRFLEDALDGSPRTEVAYNMNQVRASLAAVVEIGENSRDFRSDAEQLLRRVLAQTSDDTTRTSCLESLHRLANVPAVPAAMPAAGTAADTGAQ